MGFLTILEFIKCLFANDASDDDMDNDITSISKAKAKKSERIFLGSLLVYQKMTWMTMNCLQN